MSPKEIAERIISGDIFNVSKPITDLARAYLELEYRHKMAKERIERDRHRIGEITKLKEENQRLNKIILKELSENDELGCEYTYVRLLKKELSAEKADKQRVIDIGVNMQRRVNDRVEAENKILEGTLEEIAADMYVGYKKACGCPEAAEKCLERLRK
jgi:hypothetical protein